MSVLVLEDVGASTPGEPLRLRFNGVGNTEVVFEVDSSGQLTIRPENGDMFLGTKGDTAGDVELSTAPSGGFTGDLLILTPNASPGGVGIATAEASLGVGAAPGANAVTVVNDSSGNFILNLNHDQAAGTPQGIDMDFSADSPDDATSLFFRGQDATEDKVIIASTGDITNRNNSYTGISDESLKQDIVDADPRSQWDDIKAMRFRKFRWKTEVARKGGDALVSLGCIAQEMRAVSPGLVSESRSNRVVTEELDETGIMRRTVTDTGGGDPVLSLKYSILYMKGMVVLQELIRRVEALEA